MTGPARPQRLHPALDQGYAIVIVQLPTAHSLSRTDAVVRRVSDIALKTPGALNAVAFAGFSAATFTNATNAAAVFVPFKHSRNGSRPGRPGDSIIKDLFGRMQAVEEAFIIVVAPPPVRGIGSTGGFKMQVQEKIGAEVGRVLASSYELMRKAQGDPKLAGVYTTFSNGSPQIYLAIDRQKAQVLQRADR